MHSNSMRVKLLFMLTTHYEDAQCKQNVRTNTQNHVEEYQYNGVVVV